jgi:hypothetical protein
VALLRALPAALLALSTLSLDPARPLVATPANESQPFGRGGALVWTDARREFSLLHLGLGDVRLRLADGRTTRVNPRGTLAAAGGLSRRLLVLAVVRGGNSDLVLVDRVTRLMRVPKRVNTLKWEWRGTLSRNRLLFGRIEFAAHRFQIVLADLAAGSVRVLDTVEGHAAYVEPGQIAGRYAVWARCPDNLCSIVRYDLATGRIVRAPNGAAYSNPVYAPSVGANGAVYYARSNRRCGSGVTLLRWQPGSPPGTLQRLPAGFDLRFSSTEAIPGGTRVLFDRIDCARKTADVYAVDDR